MVPTLFVNNRIVDNFANVSFHPAELAAKVRDSPPTERGSPAILPRRPIGP